MCPTGTLIILDCSYKYTRKDTLENCASGFNTYQCALISLVVDMGIDCAHVTWTSDQNIYLKINVTSYSSYA